MAAFSIDGGGIVCLEAHAAEAGSACSSEEATPSTR